MRLEDKVCNVPGHRNLDNMASVFALLHPFGLPELQFSSFPLYFTLRASFISLNEGHIQSQWCMAYTPLRSFTASPIPFI